MYWMWLLLCQWLDKLLWEQKCIPYSLGVARQSCFLLWRVVLAFGFGRSLAFGLLEMKSSEQFFILNAFIARHKTSVPFQSWKDIFSWSWSWSWFLIALSHSEPQWASMRVREHEHTSFPTKLSLRHRHRPPKNISPIVSAVNCAPILLVDIVGWYSD